MITLKINRDEVSLECDGTKDFKELTSKENLDKIKGFAKTFNDEVVKPRYEMEAQVSKECNALTEACQKVKREHEIKLIRISEEQNKRSDLRYMITDVVRKTGCAAGITAVVLGGLKIADKIISSGEPVEAEKEAPKKIEKKEEKKEKEVSKKK